MKWSCQDDCGPARDILPPMWFKPNIPKLRNRGDLVGLIKAANHSDADIRKAATDALSTLRGSINLAPLIGWLQSPERFEPGFDPTIHGWHHKFRLSRAHSIELACLIADEDLSCRYAMPSCWT